MLSVGTTEDIPTNSFMHPKRQRLRARHIWEKLDIQWNLLADRLYTPWPTGMTRNEIYWLIFCNNRQGCARWKENEYRGADSKEVRARWDQLKDWFHWWKSTSCPPIMEVSGFFQQFEEKEAAAREQLATLRSRRCKHGEPGKESIAKSLCLMSEMWTCSYLHNDYLDLEVCRNMGLPRGLGFRVR